MQSKHSPSRARQNYPPEFGNTDAERAARYEALKAAWRRHNPDAAPPEYEAAMQRLGRKAGI